MSNSTEDLFGAASAAERGEQPASAGVAPLAVRMRPRTLDEVRGQTMALRPGSPLRRLIEGSGGVLDAMKNASQARVLICVSTCDPDRLAALAARVADRQREMARR